MFGGKSPEQMLSSKKKDGNLRKWQCALKCVYNVDIL